MSLQFLNNTKMKILYEREDCQKYESVFVVNKNVRIDNYFVCDEFTSKDKGGAERCLANSLS